jgi:hypothetical protein
VVALTTKTYIIKKTFCELNPTITKINYPNKNFLKTNPGNTVTQPKKVTKLMLESRKK